MNIKVDRQPFDPGPAAWNCLLGERQGYPALAENKTADFLVVGAGFAGLAAARRLRQLEPGCSIVVLEARKIGEGPAGRNSGFMIDLPHNLGSKDYAGNEAQDRIQTGMNREAIGFAKQAAEELEMSAEAFCISGKINAAATAKGDRHNQGYASYLSHLGEKFELLDDRSMKDVCGSDYYRSGLFTPGTAMIQPALFVHNLAKGLHQKRIDIYENSPVVSVQRESSSWSAKTPAGKINAGKIVLAINGHIESFGFFKRRLMHIYLYASMTRELTDKEIETLGGQGQWAFTPADSMGTTVRKISGTSGDRIIVRNRFTWAPDRSISENKLSSIARVHDRSFKKRFPQLNNVSMDYRWGGLLCLSRNVVPAFGEVETNIYSACCQNGLGTAMGTLSGKLAAELALAQSSSTLENTLSMDEPKRLPPEPFATIGANAYMRWGEFTAGKEL